MSIDDVTDLTPRVQYVASAAQTVFPYPFPVFQAADLVVVVDDVAQVLTTDYAVSGEGDDLGGNVTFVTPLIGGEIVTIYRDTVIERTTDVQQNGPIASATFNDELDKLYVIAQELKAKIGRAIRFPFTATQTDAASELSPIANWYNKFLYIGSTGLLEAAATISGVVALTQSVIGNLLNPQTAAELAAGKNPSNKWYAAPNIFRYGATGDGTTDDATAINDALACNDYAFVPEPSVAFRINSTISVPDNKGIVGVGLASLIAKGANGAMLSLGRTSYVDRIYLNGTGATYSGVGITVPFTAEFEGFQRISNSRIYDTVSYCVQYVSGSAGAGFNSRVDSCDLRTVADAVPCIKWGNDPTNKHGERTVIDCTAGSGCLLDCDNADNGFVIGNTSGDGGGLAAIIYGASSAKIMAIGNRFAATAATVMQGQAHTFVGNVHAGGLTLASGTVDCHVGNNVIVGTVTDSSGQTNQLDIRLRSYTCNWTGASSNPAIGDGTAYAFESREGAVVTADIGINIGSTTTFGSGEYRFSLPRSAGGSTNYFGGTAVFYDSSANTYYTGVVQITAAGTYLTVIVHNTNGAVSPTIPFTFANGDLIRIQARYSV